MISSLLLLALLFSLSVANACPHVCVEKGNGCKCTSPTELNNLRKSNEISEETYEELLKQATTSMDAVARQYEVRFCPFADCTSASCAIFTQPDCEAKGCCAASGSISGKSFSSMDIVYNSRVSGGQQGASVHFYQTINCIGKPFLLEVTHGTNPPANIFLNGVQYNFACSKCVKCLFCNEPEVQIIRDEL